MLSSEAIRSNLTKSNPLHPAPSVTGIPSIARLSRWLGAIRLASSIHAVNECEYTSGVRPFPRLDRVHWPCSSDPSLALAAVSMMHGMGCAGEMHGVGTDHNLPSIAMADSPRGFYAYTHKLRESQAERNEGGV